MLVYESRLVASSGSAFAGGLTSWGSFVILASIQNRIACKGGDMEISAFQENGRVAVTILEVRGNIDSSTADKLRQRADDALKAGTRDLVLDLTNVHYVSSAGLRVFNQLFNQLHPETMDKNAAATQKAIVDGTFKSPHLKLCGLNPNVRQVLSMAGFDMYLDILPDRKGAVAAF